MRLEVVTKGLTKSSPGEIAEFREYLSPKSAMPPSIPHTLLVKNRISNFPSIVGSFSRTAVNFFAGCKSPVSNIIMAVTVFITLEFLTRLLYYTPVAILASIILSALPGLIDVREAWNVWKVDKMDFLACIGAFIGVLFGSVEIGLMLAVAVANPGWQVIHKMKLAGLVERIGVPWIFLTVGEAVEAFPKFSV